MVVGIIYLLVLILLPFVNRGPCHSARSEDRLRQLGMFVACFAEDNGGALPDDFAVLAEAFPEMHPSMFVRPRGIVPAAKTLGQMLRDPGHISFAWTGGGLVSPLPPDAVLAYETGFASYEQGTAVLFGDYSARVVRRDELRELIAATQRRLDMPLPGLPMELPAAGRDLANVPPAGAASRE